MPCWPHKPNFALGIVVGIGIGFSAQYWCSGARKRATEIWEGLKHNLDVFLAKNCRQANESNQQPTVDCPGKYSAQAGNADACQDCPYKSDCQSNKKIDSDMTHVFKNSGDIKNVVLVLSGKGGVGKSTVSTQLAYQLSKKFSVGLLDIDICGPSVPKMTGTAGKDVISGNNGWIPITTGNLKIMSTGYLLNDADVPVIWKGPKKQSLIRQFLSNVDWGQLDFLVVDTPPGTSDEHLSIISYLKGAGSTGAVLVTTPQEVALQDVRKEINFCNKAEIQILGVVENMGGSFLSRHQNSVQEMCDKMAVNYLQYLELHENIVEATEAGVPVVDMHPNDNSSKQFEELASKVEQLFLP